MLRLDRAICNEDWINFWRSTSCSALVRHQSDHHPLLLSFDFSVVNRVGTFKFFKTWSLHEDCRKILLENWTTRFRGHGLSRLQAKLRHMKKIFTHWNRTVFGNVNRQDGDRVITDPLDIEVHVVNHFQSIFSVANNCVPNNLIEETIPSMVSITENRMLMRVPQRVEIKDAVFALNGDRAPGPDGFGGHFYQTYWDIVGDDVIESVQDFFITDALPDNFNNNLIVLVSKVPGPRVMGDYRPIALANFQFKVITKILADRLVPITMRIISTEQRGFIRDRNISNCVILAFEAINSLGKKQYGGNVALKVDIAKAFDTLDWNFLLEVLRKFGFAETFVNWILVILKSARLSILVNGKAVGYFTCSRGVRQGDPLSPLLFCLAEEVLSRALSMAAASGRLLPMAYCRGVVLPTHILYADDVMIFCTGTKRNIRTLLNIFQSYSEVFGQVITNTKSRFCTGAMNSTRAQMILDMLGFSVGTVPLIYLGCPIFLGKPKVTHFQSITDRIKTKLSTWKGSLLSIMGRVQLVKSIIHGMLAYSFHIYMWPRRLLRLLDTWIKNFIWSGDALSTKVCTVSWKRISRPWAEGGLDLKPTRMINEALILKLSWNLLATDSQWAALMKRRFFINGKPLRHYIKSSVWYGVKIQIDTVLANSLWIVGSGDYISLWNDNWLGVPLVDLFNVDPFFHPGFTGKVSDIILDGGWNLPPTLMIDDVTDRLASIVLPRVPLPDTFVWSHAADGKLSSKMALQFLKLAAPQLPWAELIWKGGIPPSHSFTFWRLMHRRMPTDENLRTHGCIIVSVCCFCLRTDESSEHIFLQCPFAMSLWNWLGGKRNCAIDCTLPLSLLSCIPHQCSSQIAEIFLAAVIHTVHTIWRARNDLRFSSKATTFHSAKVRIHSLVAMSSNASGGKCLPSDFPLLDSFAVDSHCRTVKDIIPVLWKASTAPWAKVNTDGSVIAGLAACGGLFRDSTRAFLGAFCCNIGEASVFHSEVTAIILAMEHAAANRWWNIWLESDSTSALQIFSTPSLVPISLRNRWFNARSLGVQIISSHIFREGNYCANRLANRGHLIQGSVWLDSLPTELHFDFFRDRVGLPNYRFP